MIRRVKCPVCEKTVGVNRQGGIAIHMWDRKIPRKNPGRDDPFWKIHREKCPASGMTAPK